MGLKDRSSDVDMPLGTQQGWTLWSPQTGVETIASAASFSGSFIGATLLKKTTGAADTMVLPAAQPGQIVSVVVAVDGGTVVITAVAATGWTSIALADAGDQVSFPYLNDTDGWIILGTSGVAAPPAVAIS